jgi:hypothetical protein
MSVMIPLEAHEYAHNAGIVVVWQDDKTRDAVLDVGAGFIASIGGTGSVFAELFATKDDAMTALRGHRAQ